jgi:hypothetical protein
LDLAQTLDLDAGRAWVGFTGAAGGSPLNQDFFHWSFQSEENVIVANRPLVIEGSSGATSQVAFEIGRLGDLSGQTVVNWATSNGTAMAGTDYVPSSGQVVFDDAEALKTVLVTVNGDNTVEQNETFLLLLSTTASHAATGGQATILTDDVTVSISDASAVEGSSSITHLGNFVDAGTGGLDNPYALAYGPDGHIYASTAMMNSVLRFSGTTGAPFPAPGKSGATFVSPGAGGLTEARQIAFAPDGSLIVASALTNSVLRFDATTGEPLGALIASGVGGLHSPRGLLFHSDGYLYVTSVGQDAPGPGTDSVLRFDALTGAPAGVSGQPGDAVFISSGSGGLDNPSHIIFHNGDFYVSSTASLTTNSVLRYAADGSFLGPFVPTGSGGLAGPVDMDFRGGYLYVTSWTNDQVLRYRESDGAFVDVIAAGNGLIRPINLLFDADGNMLVSSAGSDEIRRYGAASQAAFTLSLSSASAAPFNVDYSTAEGSALAGSDFVTASGTLTFAPGQTSRTILVQTLDDTLVESTETFTANLSNPVGGVIVDGQGIGTIIDNDLPPTKFYVVNDASANRTYEYGPTGSAVENYNLNSGNSAPRGAASTAAGDKVWVVDANRNVYVYGPDGTPLGSWSVSGFTNSAQFTGIAVSGNTVWIVDNKSDKVYRFTGAASRLTGSQSAASSFNLNSGNKDASDLVTDGASIWVLNNASTDKVFKYTVSGSLQGSWTIFGAGGSPTGITIDPTNVSVIWIVDNNSDRVYEFNAAASRTSGSQSPASSFALAAGNTNPQGIADPPTVGRSGPDRPAPQVDSTSSATSHDAALLALTDELSSLLSPAKKRR